MKIVFVTNNSAPSKFIATHLYKKGLLNAVIIEESTSKVKTKVLREIKSASWTTVLSKIIDLFAVFVYSSLAKHYIEKHLLKPQSIDSYPEKVLLYRVKSASNPQSISILKSLKPDLLVVLGTSILKPEVLSIAKQYTLNIHGGIVPQYRNVHSDFWAISKNDIKNIGSSIIHLDPGVDTGDIAIQGSVNITPKDTLFSIKRKNTELSLQLIIQAIEMAKIGELPRTPQKNISNGFHKTPRLIDFIRLLRSNPKYLTRFS